jgi:hypothetical protein
MEERTFVSANAFCTHHRIEIAFIHSLHDYGLIEVTSAEEDLLLPREQLEALEKMVRLHYDLNINLEGIDAIYNLLQRMEILQREMKDLRSTLRLYERESLTDTTDVHG